MSETTTETIPVSAYEWMLHPILPRCLGKSEGKYDLSRPFVISEYLYATDGRIMVRMPTPDGWVIPNPEKGPKAEMIPAMIHTIFGRDDWSRWPWRTEPTELPPVEGGCAVCEGRKVLPQRPCPWCNQGTAPYEAPFCEECWGLKGEIPAGACCNCQGTGLLDAQGRIEVVPGYWLQRRYVALFHEFGMTTYVPAMAFPKDRKGWEKHGMELATRFTQGDVTGILMSMFPPEGDQR